VTSAGAWSGAGGASARGGDAGAVSPLLILLLVVMVALFLFSAVAVSRGGLSSTGGLPPDERGRKALFERHFGPRVISVKEVTLSGGCRASGQMVDIPADSACHLEVAANGSTPRTWTQELAALFRSGRRRSLPMKALAGIRVVLQQKDGSDPIGASLPAPQHTSFTIAPEGATIVVKCQAPPKCAIDLSQPAEET
jgi:hypothetical protein